MRLQLQLTLGNQLAGWRQGAAMLEACHHLHQTLGSPLADFGPRVHAESDELVDSRNRLQPCRRVQSGQKL